MGTPNTEVFLPFAFQTYRDCKVKLLQTKMKTVKTQDRIERIKEIRRIKIEQRRLLRKTLRELSQLHTKIKKLLPTEKEVDVYERAVTKTRITDIHTPNLAEYRIKARSTSKVDEELAKIQERIKNLNL